MLTRVQATFDRQGMITGEVVRAGRTLVVCRGEGYADDATRPFAVMQATMTAVFDRPGISG